MTVVVRQVEVVAVGAIGGAWAPLMPVFACTAPCHLLPGKGGQGGGRRGGQEQDGERERKREREEK